jgi:hypothetical protein
VMSIRAWSPVSARSATFDCAMGASLRMQR